jgi:hypothetical protein
MLRAAPPQVKKMAKLLNDHPEELADAALQWITQDTPPTPHQLAPTLTMHDDDARDARVLDALVGTHWLVRQCARSAAMPDALAAQLADELALSPPAVDAIVAAVERARAALAHAPPSARPPTLRELRWRLDVALSSESVGRILRPQLTLSCSLDDGSSEAFHVSKAQLDELRFAAASMLADMSTMESKLPEVIN